MKRNVTHFVYASVLENAIGPFEIKAQLAVIYKTVTIFHSVDVDATVSSDRSKHRNVDSSGENWICRE